MIINNTSRIYGSYQLPSVTQKPRVTRAEEKVDVVSVSNKAKDYHKVRMALGINQENTRADKIAELKARYEAGTYNVSGQDIAEKLFADL